MIDTFAAPVIFSLVGDCKQFDEALRVHCKVFLNRVFYSRLDLESRATEGRTKTRCRLLLADLPRTADDVLVTGQLAQTAGATSVKFVGADANLGTKTKFAAVVKSG